MSSGVKRRICSVSVIARNEAKRNDVSDLRVSTVYSFLHSRNLFLSKLSYEYLEELDFLFVSFFCFFFEGILPFCRRNVRKKMATVGTHEMSEFCHFRTGVEYKTKNELMKEGPLVLSVMKVRKEKYKKQKNKATIL